MAKIGSVLVGIFALVLGLGVAAMGVALMLESGAFAEGESSQSSGLLGLWGDSSQSASAPTAPWVGLVLVILGGAVLLFGLRALFVTSEGRGTA